MAMTRKTVYIDDATLASILEKGYFDNPSNAVNMALTIMDREGMEGIEFLIKAEAVHVEIERIKHDVRLAKYECIIKEKHLDVLQKQYDSLVADHEESKRLTALSNLVREFNQLVIASKFDHVLIHEQYGDIVKKLGELNPLFNVVTHINRLKEICEL